MNTCILSQEMVTATLQVFSRVCLNTYEANSMRQPTFIKLSMDDQSKLARSSWCEQYMLKGVLWLGEN